MQEYEIQPLIKHIKSKSKESWEQTRFLGYLIASITSTKKLKPKDIIEFPWDNQENTYKGEIEISDSQIERLKNKSKYFIKNGTE